MGQNFRRKQLECVKRQAVQKQKLTRVFKISRKKRLTTELHSGCVVVFFFQRNRASQHQQHEQKKMPERRLKVFGKSSAAKYPQRFVGNVQVFLIMDTS